MTATYTGPNGPADPDDERPSAPDKQEDWDSHACRACGDPRDGAPVVCQACREAGWCACCGEEHHTWQCPKIAAVRRDLEAADRCRDTPTVLKAIEMNRAAIRHGRARLLAMSMEREAGIPF